MALPLDGILVVDFSQFLAGPYAALRLQDLGARVIKVENPSGGDLSRQLYLSETMVGDDSTLFHAINRGKESIALDLKTKDGLAQAKMLARKANIVIQNFRPGVIDRLGLSYSDVKAINPSVVYGAISGYGHEGPWRDLPGQDLLAQARSGLMWLSGNADAGPVPVGIPLADLLAGATLAQGLLAGLYRQGTQGAGSLVETSLLESLVDAQFEFLTTYLNNGQRAPQREISGSAHGYLGAPYGVYETAEGQLALSMTALDKLADLLALPDLAPFATTPGAAFTHRAAIRVLIASRLITKTAQDWEDILSAQGVWCARILQWDELMTSKSFQALDMLSDVNSVGLLRAPLRIDEKRPDVKGLGPTLNADAQKISAEFFKGSR